MGCIFQISQNTTYALNNHTAHCLDCHLVLVFFMNGNMHLFVTLLLVS
jgi:hypothetical protein